MERDSRRGRAAAAREARAAARQRSPTALLQLFAAAIAAARGIRARILVWQPIARPRASCFLPTSPRLDRAAGGTFPFSPAAIEAAHAQWTTDWLAWSCAHDAEYKLKATIAAHELTAQGAGGMRPRTSWTRSNARNSICTSADMPEYVRVAKALQALIAP